MSHMRAVFLHSVLNKILLFILRISQHLNDDYITVASRKYFYIILNPLNPTFI